MPAREPAREPHRKRESHRKRRGRFKAIERGDFGRGRLKRRDEGVRRERDSRLDLIDDEE